MSLKFKRNIPLILFLVAFMSFLAFALGDERVVSYTITMEPAATVQAITINSTSPGESLYEVGLSATQASDANTQVNGSNEATGIVPELINNQ